jgi:hypothetical protein
MRFRYCPPKRFTSIGFGALTALCVAGAVPLGVVLNLSMSKPSLADEGGASMYLAGSYGSLAAVPGVPGWSLALVYLHEKASSGTPFGYASARSDLLYAVPTYAFATPVLGGQLALSMASAIGRVQSSIDAIAYDRQQGFDDPLASGVLRWGAGVHNYMVYGQGEIPIGTYDPLRLANFGLGHGGIDLGGGYTYFDQKTGYEYSAVAGLTYNLKNTWTDYQNGIDSHIDWGASKFLTKELHIGLVGYYYQQLTADRGQPSYLGEFKSRVVAVGPQIGYFFPIADAQGYVSLKAYGEFAAENRPSGVNAWLSFVLTPKAPEAAEPALGRPPLGH